MSELNELYQQLILDHNKSPRNYHKLENATYVCEGYNPLCGDHYNVYVKLKGDVIEDISFEGEGCAISKASASLMTMEIKGKRISEAEDLFEKFHIMLTGDNESDVDIDEFGKLAVLSGVRDYPNRIKCASLAWHTMKDALQKEKEGKVEEK